MEEVEQFDDISIEDLAEGVLHMHLPLDNDTRADETAELPENAPRYVVLSYELNHTDGRKSFPLVLLNWAPRSSEISLLTLHASAYLDFQATVRPPMPISHATSL